MKIIFNYNECKDTKLLKKTYKKYGVIIIKDFFKNDSIFDSYDKDL